jgi:hypothetical protein
VRGIGLIEILIILFILAIMAVAAIVIIVLIVNRKNKAAAPPQAAAYPPAPTGRSSFCPNCGKPLNPGQNFCDGCRTKIN